MILGNGKRFFEILYPYFLVKRKYNFTINAQATDRSMYLVYNRRRFRILDKNCCFYLQRKCLSLHGVKKLLALAIFCDLNLDTLIINVNNESQTFLPVLKICKKKYRITRLKFLSTNNIVL